MQLKFLADESVNFNIVRILRALNYEVVSVLEERRGSSDFTVLEFAKEREAILLTEDKDFGEWVFAYHIKNLSVILLRYSPDETDQIVQSLTKLIGTYKESLFNKFVVLKKNNFRIRDL
ncbi:MAG: DUF5615 family PIN-like protein [Ignavibacteriaceae bacterium]